MSDLVYEDESYQIIGAAYEVYNEMGSEFKEPIYQECLQIELKRQEIPFEQQRELTLTYKDTTLDKRYVADLVCFGHIILELKAVERITTDHEAQLLNYLNIEDAKLGLLLNFGARVEPELKRIVH